MAPPETESDLRNCQALLLTLRRKFALPFNKSHCGLVTVFLASLKIMLIYDMLVGKDAAKAKFIAMMKSKDNNAAKPLVQ